MKDIKYKIMKNNLILCLNVLTLILGIIWIIVLGVQYFKLDILDEYLSNKQVVVVEHNIDNTYYSIEEE